MTKIGKEDGVCFGGENGGNLCEISWGQRLVFKALE
jgi:hypothetical protein